MVSLTLILCPLNKLDRNYKSELEAIRNIPDQKMRISLSNTMYSNKFDVAVVNAVILIKLIIPTITYGLGEIMTHSGLLRKGGSHERLFMTQDIESSPGI